MLDKVSVIMQNLFMKMCLIDCRADIKILNKIETLGFEICLMPLNKNASFLCESHPDISLCRISNNELIYSKDCDEKLLSTLHSKGLILIEGNSSIGSKYPSEIKYNAARIGKYLIHKLNSTDSKILEECEKRNIELLNVKQGYTQCSLAVVKQDLAITSDLGIYNTLKNTEEISLLLIPPQESIRLYDGKTGFIGGASGRIDDQHFSIAGNASLLNNYKEINKFLENNEVKLISLSDEMPFDLGTLMFFTL